MELGSIQGDRYQIYGYAGGQLYDNTKRAHEAFEALHDEWRRHRQAEAEAAADANAKAIEARAVDIFRRAAERSRQPPATDMPNEGQREPVSPPAA